ncbi:uncharacterized protein LOC116019553 [Ipomoea triloba]|uniref:uncharacterized protein LOC116019553 n=1 Tax=Ipomoea triloba TaxID=35885 RepID=UPI00125DA8BA|nr:uncharacterized protein LOC116019553 [Ipomoea triloba]XP_031115677.1 uncharacterized protein LOC116019553 [Ipomoea triloba]
MAGKTRFEAPASPDSGFAGNFSNGQRGNGGADSRMFGYGKVTSRISGAGTGEMPPLSQCLTLDQIKMGDQKYPRSGELRRVLGISVGSTLEDNAFGATHLKTSPPVSTEEVKRLRANLADTCGKASGRAKKFDELLHKLNKFGEVTKKPLRNEALTNERSGSSNLKMGTQVHRGLSDQVTLKTEDRTKNVSLNKRVRTSVAETRSEFRGNGQPRQQLLMTKDRDKVKQSNASTDSAEEKIRRLPAGGEGWDKKMKRKRSVGSVTSRPSDNDGEPKRNVHHKFNSELGLSSCDPHSLRSGTFGGAGGNSKLEGTLSTTSAHATLKNEREKSPLSRGFTAGLNKEKALAKGSIKLNSCEESHAASPGPITKGKASRASRSGLLVGNNSTPTIPRIPGTLESWDQPSNLNKSLCIGGANNRKRPLPAGSSSPPITQWIGQRPQKISRTRRVNLVSPVSNNDEMQMSSEGCSPSDFGARSTYNTVNGSLLSKGATSGTQSFKVKPESVLSPGRLSESEESGVGENRFKEKGTGNSEGEEKTVNGIQNTRPPMAHAKKNKLLVKDNVGDGVRRQGRSGRGSSFARGDISPAKEKLDNLSMPKPLRGMRPASDKNCSKSGRPMKKQTERKGFSRLGLPVSGGSPGFTGESDDDQEELLSAAKSAYNFSIHACSSVFWKKVESLFTMISSEEKTYLLEQLKSAKELHTDLTHISCSNNGVMGDNVQDEISASDVLSDDQDRCKKNSIESKESANTSYVVDRFQESMLYANLDSDRILNEDTSLYQRVLSALIVEDDSEVYEENGFEKDSPDDASPFVDSGNKNRGGMEFECESRISVQSQKNGTTNRFAQCNGHNSCSSTRAQDPPCSTEMLVGDSGYTHSDSRLLAGLSRCNDDCPENSLTSSFDVSSFDHQYAQMPVNDKLLLELQSLGLYVETVPGLEDKEDDLINQEIMQLERGLCQQIDRKKTSLDKMAKTMEGREDVDCWDPEQVAMNKLVEVAYKKLLATRGSLAAKIGVPKVSRQVALAYARRTLARCRKFEESGTSCFSEPSFRDIIFAPPHRMVEAELLTGPFIGSADGDLDSRDTSNQQSDQAFVRTGPISNRGKKKEVLLDDVSGTASRATSTLGGAKGKRSERDRDSAARNEIPKAGHLSLGISKGDRKTKTKPKQKTAQLSTSGNGTYNKKFSEPVMPLNSGEANGNMKIEGNVPLNSPRQPKESADLANLPLPLNDIDQIGLDVAPDIGGAQDLNSWFNFDDDGLQDDDCIGLEIPMDDLSELNMF